LAVVLCTGVDPGLTEKRRQLLEDAGHNVSVAMDFGTVERVCSDRHFDVVVLGQGLIAPEKRRVAQFIRTNCNSTKILELHVLDSRAVADADDWLAVPAQLPSDFPKRVAALAKKHSSPRNSSAASP
jgi:DNA-binding response OmpR family regulator